MIGKDKIHEINKTKQLIVIQSMRSIPDPQWTGILLRYQQVSSYTEITGTYLNRDQRKVAFEVPVQMGHLLAKLRKDMYDNTRGTWLSMRLLIGVDKKASFKFNYMDEPYWEENKVREEDYVDDIKEYPRDFKFNPWYKK